MIRFNTAAVCLSLFAAASSFGSEFKFCPGEYSLNLYSKSTETMKNADYGQPSMQSRIVCGHEKYGDYLYVGHTNQSFRIDLLEQCDSVLKSMDAHRSTAFVFSVDDKSGKVVHIRRAKELGCDARGAIIDRSKTTVIEI